MNEIQGYTQQEANSVFDDTMNQCQEAIDHGYLAIDALKKFMQKVQPAAMLPPPEDTK